MNGFLWNEGIFRLKIGKQKNFTRSVQQIFLKVLCDEKHSKVTFFHFPRATLIMLQTPPFRTFSSSKLTFLHALFFLKVLQLVNVFVFIPFVLAFLTLSRQVLKKVQILNFFLYVFKIIQTLKYFYQQCLSISIVIKFIFKTFEISGKNKKVLKEQLIFK